MSPTFLESMLRQTARCCSNHKVFMDAGHDEYWTEAQRANVEAAAHAGVNLAFLTGNEIFMENKVGTQHRWQRISQTAHSLAYKRYARKCAD